MDAQSATTPKPLFLLFLGVEHEPMGGAQDFEGAAETLEGAQALLFPDGPPAGNNQDPRWAHVTRLEGHSLKVVATFTWDLRLGSPGSSDSGWSLVSDQT